MPPRGLPTRESRHSHADRTLRTLRKPPDAHRWDRPRTDGRSGVVRDRGLDPRIGRDRRHRPPHRACRGCSAVRRGGRLGPARKRAGGAGRDQASPVAALPRMWGGRIRAPGRRCRRRRRAGNRIGWVPGIRSRQRIGERLRRERWRGGGVRSLGPPSRRIDDDVHHGNPAHLAAGKPGQRDRRLGQVEPVTGPLPIPPWHRSSRRIRAYHGLPLLFRPQPARATASPFAAEEP